MKLEKILTIGLATALISLTSITALAQANETTPQAPVILAPQDPIPTTPVGVVPQPYTHQIPVIDTATPQRSAADVVGFISQEQAIQIALSKINGKVIGIAFEDHGWFTDKPVYEVTIVVGNTEFEVDVHAVTGKIVNVDKDRIDSMAEVNAIQSVTLTHAQAQQIALSLYPSGKSFYSKLDDDTFPLSYEVEVVLPDATHFDVHVGATTGEIVQNMPGDYFMTTYGISVEQTNSIALNKKNGTIIKTELNSDNGALYYEVDILTKGNNLAEVKVNAMTGKVYNFIDAIKDEIFD